MQALCIQHGVAVRTQHEFRVQERGFDLGKRFKGEVTMAGKDKGKDCSVGTQDLTGKVRNFTYHDEASPVGHLILV